MFTNNKRVVPIKASPTYESRSGTSNGQTKGNKDSNAGLPMVELTNHDDADQFELQMNIEMDKFNEHMHAEDDKIRANLKAPQNLGALGGIKSGRVGPGGNLDSSRIDTDILEPDQGQSVEEADEGEEEVLLAHDMPGAGAKATESLRKAFSAMKLQVEEFQRRTQQAMDERSEMQKRVFELEDKIDMQEDEISTLQQQVQTGGGGFVLKGGGGGGKAMKIGNAGDKLRHELKESGNMEELELGLSEDVSNLSLYKRIVAWAAKKKPFQKDIRTIQAKFGSAPASYFIFYRFIFLQVCLIAFVGAVFIVLHLALLAGEDGRTFSELMTSKGFLPGFMLFSTFSRYEAFQYSTFIIFGLLVFSVSIGEHLIAEDKSMKRIDKQEEGNEAPYSKIALCAWDFGSAGYFPTARQVDEQLASQSLTLMVQWEETRTAGLMKSRSRYELLVLYSRRFAALIAYLAVQAGSFTAIVLVTINTDAITQWLSTTPFSNFASILAPLSLNVLNTLAPPILKLITLQEKWDSGQMQLNVLLFRMYFSNILNTLILGLSYLMLADPFLFAQFSTVRQSLQLAESGVFDCRIDQAADAMFSLIVTNFFIGNIQMVVMGYVYRFLYSKIFECLGKDFEPFPFEVEPAMINLFNNMSLVMITFPFAPQAMVFLPISIYISVKVEVFAICTFNGKPERTWKAHQSGVIFTSFYLLTLVLIGLPTAVYFLSCTSFPKDCLIQDWDIGLCNAEMDYNNICEKDPTDKYYPFYSNINYPKDICSKSCGPFVDYEYNMLPFKQVLTSFSLLDFIWGLFFNSSYVTWIVILVLIVNGYRTRNTRETQRESDEAKERSMSIQIEALEAEKKRQDKLIARMKLQAAAEEEAQNINTSRFDS